MSSNSEIGGFWCFELALDLRDFLISSVSSSRWFRYVSSWGSSAQVPYDTFELSSYPFNVQFAAGCHAFLAVPDRVCEVRPLPPELMAAKRQFLDYQTWYATGLFERVVES